MCRYRELQVYEVPTNTAVNLVAAARQAAPVSEAVVALAESSMYIQQAGHLKLTRLHLLCSGAVVWQPGACHTCFK